MAEQPAHLGLYRTLCGIGVGEGYAHDIATNRRRPSRKLAVSIFRQTGLKLGPIAQATDEEIAVLERLEARAA